MPEPRAARGTRSAPSGLPGVRAAAAGRLRASAAGRGWRVCLAAVAVAALALTASGCAKFDAALGQQWATVTFKSNTSVATLLKVRTACSHVPNVRAEALPRKRTAGTMMYALTYRTDKASDANLAQLQQCLQRYPQVEGIDFQDSGDDG